ncbi:MAG: NUDIX hydrolase [Patescibacteria group bacterium]
MPKQLQLLLVRLTHDEFLISVVGVTFNDQDEVLLLKHTYRDPPWGLPCGYINAREHPKEALEREIKEETGLVISVDRRMKIRTDRDTARLEIVYLATFIGGDFQPSDEVEAVQFFEFDQLPLLTNKQLFLINKSFEIRRQTRPQNLFSRLFDRKKI